MSIQTVNLSVSIYKKWQSYEMYKIGLFYKKFMDNFMYNVYYGRKTEKDYLLFNISRNLMIDCFTSASSHGNVSAMYELALYYESQSQYKRMNKYFFMAIKRGCVNSMLEIGKYFESTLKYHDLRYRKKLIRKHNLIQKYYLMAFNRGHLGAIYRLGIYFQKIELYEQMEYYLEIAVDNGNFWAALELGNYYANVEHDEELMLQYYKICYNNNILAQNSNLLKYYENDIMRLYGWLKSLELENKATHFLMRDLETFSEVKIYLAEENKHDECRICLNTKLLVKIKSCCNGHEVCVDCYWKMDRICYYRC